MLNGDGNENCKKNNSLISNKKQLCTCSTLFCQFLCRCFARPQRKTFQLHILWKTSVLCAHQRFCCLCSCSLFFFRCRSFLPCQLLLASHQHFSFSNGWPIQNFHVVFPAKFVSFVFLSLALALSLLSTSVQTLKLSRKKTELNCCFFSLKVRVATQFRAKNLEFHLGCHTC